ncbi:MAG: heavy-metal-associated domain-containing protein [Actinobacteria bacterium]|nr:heavy-metal-associated domain-containing protein [Actinomycetota bacterium]
MTTTRVSVPGIHCDHCKAAIEGAVSKAEGVQRVQVDLPTKQVTVEHDTEMTGVGRLVGLIEDQGYDVESFEDVPAE